MSARKPAPALHPGETLGRGLRRVILGCLADAGQALERRPSSDDIHTARIRLKQARAAVRLYTRADKQFVQAARRRLAALARRLAPYRDATVVAATARELARNLDGSARILALRLARPTGPRLPLRKAEACHRVLVTEYQRLARLRFPFLPSAQVTRVLRHNLKRARQRARGKLSRPAQLHSWRKAVLLLRDQVLTLGPVLPSKAPRFAARLKQVTRRLGQVRDLQLVIDVLPARAAGRSALLKIARRLLEKRIAQARRHWTKARRHGKRTL